MHSIKCFFTNTTHVIIGNIGQPFTVTCLKCLRVVAAATYNIIMSNPCWGPRHKVLKWWPVVGF